MNPARFPFAIAGIACALWLAMVPSTLHATLRLASPFTDHMVLQREMPVPVWGKADPGTKITVEFSGDKQETTTEASGKWRVNLEPLPASAKPQTLTVSSDASGKTITLFDVLVGEVWICSGQSNMAMTADGIPKIRALKSKNATIRSFKVENTVAFEEQDTCSGEWVDAPPDSAVGKAFAHFLETSAKVPVGIILTSWGSSSLEAWMPRDMTENTPHFKTIMDEFDANDAAHDRIKAALEGPGRWSKEDDIFLRRQPNILYNAMMKPLAPFACRGIVWYQGERNTQSMHGMVRKPWFSRNSGMLLYGDVLKKWMKRYRQEWGRPDLHFLIVMLPGFGKILEARPEDTPESPDAHSWAWMREAQLQALELPSTGVVNTIDLGDVKEIHPKDKLPIGRRLALLAARDTLDQKIEAQGPVMQSVETQNGSLIVHFENAEGLKTTDGKAPAGFWLADDTGKWLPAEASIQGQAVVLNSSGTKQPLYVRYAFAGKPRVNLVNAANLPAYPFRTDRHEP